MRDRSLPFDSGCVYNGNLTQGSLYLHLLSVNRLCCCDETLYLYYDKEGMYKALKPGKEWLSLSMFFSDTVCQSINSHTVKEIVQRLKITKEIQIEPEQLNSRSDLINIKDCC